MSDRVSPDSSSGGADESSSGLNAESLYKAPAQKSLQEILETDKEDESLVKYKASLGLGKDAVAVIIDASNPKNVLVRKLVLVVEGRPDVVMDLSEANSLEKKTFTIKEGCQYRLRIEFHIQREIVTGLKYIQKVSRVGVQVDKEEYMLGSYGPRTEIQSYTTPVEEAPCGMVHRGTYKVKSLFTDDDNHEWLAWHWNLEIKKDWE